MSFSGDIKKELAGIESEKRHCNQAELAAIFRFCGTFEEKENGTISLKVHTENELLANKCFTLMEKSFNISGSVRVRQINDKTKSFDLLWEGDGLMAVKHDDVQRVCCKRAYIRGAFLAAGSVSDPQKSYHYEIVCSDKDLAIHLKNIIRYFDIAAKIVSRKSHYVVYVKEGSQIVDVLNVMGAHVALMELENVRIVKEMRNSVNRQVNCETANINKIVSASVRQKEDIRLIAETKGLDQLPIQLQEIARIRLDNPAISLKDLGQMLDPPIGKSGVNHRLRKLSEMAENIRNSGEGWKSYD